MFKVDAIIRLERLDDVKSALEVQGFEEFAVTEVHGHGSHEETMACYRGVKYEIPFTQQVRVELNVPDSTLDLVVESILNAAHTGRPGDGKIFVTQLADVIEISLDRPLTAAHAGPAPRTRLATVGSTMPAPW